MNALSFLKNGLQKLSTPQSIPITSVKDEILKRLYAVEERISASTAALLKPVTYADQARLALLQSVNKKPVPSRALKEITVKVIYNPAPNPTGERLIESINATQFNKAGKVVAACK
jgi:hypothetical protein